MANIDVVLMVMAVVAAVMGLVVVATYYVNKATETNA
jgi:hypothetical protein